MQTKREYLVSLGLAKPGRGKFSGAGNEALAKALASGMKFSDAKPVTAPVVKEEGAKSTPVVKVSDSGNTPYLTQDEYRFPEKDYRAVVFENGKKKEVSLRECCNLCRVSLVNHMCDAPTILGNRTVRIEKR